jgi:amyloid beta precursor protein binding protein 1
LLNCGPTGAETLKNLVLGGIAAFTVVDATSVTARDLGNNFMVDLESLGTPKAKCVCAHLNELNEAVSGSFVEDKPEYLIESNPSFFDNFTLVIATQLCENIHLKLDSLLRQKGIPLLIARTYGLMGYVRLSLDEHCIIESKPDSRVDDLRLHEPWDELKAFSDSFDLASLDAKLYKHVPWGVLLMHVADKWRACHEGHLPTSTAERRELKEMLKVLSLSGCTQLVRIARTRIPKDTHWSFRCYKYKCWWSIYYDLICLCWRRDVAFTKRSVVTVGGWGPRAPPWLPTYISAGATSTDSAPL